MHTASQCLLSNNISDNSYVARHFHSLLTHSSPASEYCPNGQISSGYCSAGVCTGGFTCTANNICCPLRARADLVSFLLFCLQVCIQSKYLESCPNGQAALGVCSNNICQNGNACINGVCCPGNIWRIIEFFND